MKKFLSLFGLIVLMALLTGVISAAAPMPHTTFTLVSGLPATMNVGETKTVTIRVDSDIPFMSIQALPDFQFPGKGVVAVQGGDRSGSDTSATLNVTFKAKSSTANFPDGGVALVSVVVGVRYGGGVIIVERFPFSVSVP